MKNRFVIALVLLLILSTIKIENILKYNSKFNIKHVEIENNMILSDSEIKASLAFLYETNFFLLKSNDNGQIPPGTTVVVTVTGHGLKDPEIAVENSKVKSVVINPDISSVLNTLEIT